MTPTRAARSAGASIRGSWRAPSSGTRRPPGQRALRAGLAEQLLQLEPRLLALQQNHGSPAAWLDADALQRRLGSLRHRLSRWWGRYSRTAQREAAVTGLMELA
ncbi:MAG: hypothetical protein ACO21B_07795, partial [Gemmobacter sp.]